MRICAATRQAVFMITHDVDESILLADRILLMSNGPDACIAEVVENTLPKPRDPRSRQWCGRESTAATGRRPRSST